jgi:hydroxymethylpyrimidine pyrophosphatase-like HAD family hydrolase
LEFFATRPDGVNTNIDSDSYEKKSNWINSDWDDAKRYEFTRISALNLSAQDASELEDRMSCNSNIHVAKAFLPYNGLWAVDFTHDNVNKGTAATKIAPTVEEDGLAVVINEVIIPGLS